MRIFFVIFPAIILSFTVCAETPVLQSQPDVLTLLKDMQAKIDHIAEEVEKLREKKNQEEPAGVTSRANVYRGFDTNLLNGIILPQSPTEEQVREYINKIMESSERQNSFSNSDPQIEMLAKIGSQNIGIFIDEIKLRQGGRFAGQFYVAEALRGLADQSNKDIIISELVELPMLASIVYRRGWEKDARAVLLQEVDAVNPMIGIEWIQAVVRLRDPDSYPMLRRYFIEGPNQVSTFNAIRNLPIEDLAGAVDQVWKNRTNENSIHMWGWGNNHGLVGIALSYGHKDALDELLQLSKNNQFSQSLHWAQQYGHLLRRHVDFRGSTEEILSWLDQNYANLVFDEKTKKFTLPKPGQ